jgi:hypothetical protein
MEALIQSTDLRIRRLACGQKEGASGGVTGSERTGAAPK